MELNYAMSYRITTLELEQAAIRAERARMAAENADLIVRRDGILRRALRRLQARRAAVVPAPAVETREAETAVATPAASAVAPTTQIAELVSASDETRDRELVGCVSHAA
ncbi:hypothetical protein LXM50_12265 [Microbacterium sp. Au-Mic1]|uniref:hypothetical protein n=1 Tax=Microbacterium sp. Au-Mic1 TaxID=2906457 RepID=UPI001E610627|nr:hypothetical protein [Microbacterium sp. Au-Mic1]MCE4026743.1 hypothetical protein [Microbacterium sp. Au-Mic1]